MPKRSLLLAVDIEDQSPSSRRCQAVMSLAASFLAERLETGIQLLYVEDLRMFPRGRLSPSRIMRIRAGHSEALTEFSTRFSAPRRISLETGSPADRILKTCGSCELVIMGTRGRKGLSRLLVGSVAEEVIRHSRRPVMIVGPAAQEKERYPAAGKGLKILVATDLGKNSRPAERYALSLAKRIGAEVVLFHCPWDTIHTLLVNAAYSGLSAFRLEELVTETRDDAIDVLKEKTAFFRKHGVNCDYKLEDEAVLSGCGVYRQAETGYAMIVMGTRGRTALLNAFFGSTARDTILNSPVPVIIVHSG